jgi:predicted GIY-YIG superfamily endonuclease
VTEADNSAESESTTPAVWFVYVLVSTDGGRTYVGISTDVERRLQQHNGELPGGARSTRAGRPWSLGRTLGPYDDRGFALKMELALKKRSGGRRLSVEVERLEQDAGG